MEEDRKPVHPDGRRKEKHPVDLDRSGGRDGTMDQRTEIFLLGVTNK